MAKNIEVLEEEKDIFRLADLPSQEELDALVHFKWGDNFVFGVLTGEFRPPKAGEWFLSGALPEGYRANNDLSTKYKIIKLCVVDKVSGYELVRG